MIRLNSFQLSSTSNCFGEDLILSGGYSSAAWSADTDLKRRFSQESFWFTEDDTGGDTPFGSRITAVGIHNSFVYLESDGSLNVVDFDTDYGVYADSAEVAAAADEYAVPESVSSLEVVYSIGPNLYRKTRTESTKTWGTAELLLTESSNITSLSFDTREGYRAVAYTTANSVGLYQDPIFQPFTPITGTDIVDDVNIRLSTAYYDFEMVYTKRTGSGNRSIEAFHRSALIDSQSQVVDTTDDNYAPDLFVDTTSGVPYVVWVSDGYVRYRERSVGSWQGLVGSDFVDSCDFDAQPKVVYFGGYARVLYKKNNAMYYSGLIPSVHDVGGVFYCSAWGATKLVADGNTSISSSLVKNALSQLVDFRQDLFSVGGVSCYLRKMTSDQDLSFSVTMEIYYADRNGKPYANAIASSTLQHTDISVDGWYEFPFNLDALTGTLDGYCFVMYQTGGGENDYVAWLHYANGGSGAFVSADRTTWESQPNVTRSLRVRGNFNAYEHIINSDPAQITYQFVTPPAVPASDYHYTYSDLNSGVFDNTILYEDIEPGYGGVPTPSPEESQTDRIYGYTSVITDWKIKLEEKNTVISFVMDGSGSSGWNDVFDLRKAIATNLYNKFMARTSVQTVFDVVKFGGVLLDNVSIGQSRKLRGVVVDIEDTSAMYGYDKDGNSLTGSVRDHLETGVIAYGFKNLSAATTYQMYGVDLGWKSIRWTEVEEGWHSLWSVGGPTFSVQGNGPEGQSILNIDATTIEKSYSRFFYGNTDNTVRTLLTADVTIGDLSVFVTSVTGLSEDRSVNILDRHYANIDFVADAIDTVGKEVTLDRVLNYAFLTSNGAVLETHRPERKQLQWERTNTFEFFVVDSLQKGAITFFVQCNNGATIEWEFIPSEWWDLSSLYFLGETAGFEVNGVNSQGETLPDGTLVEFYVNKTPPIMEQMDEEKEQQKYLLKRDALTGATVLYVGTEALQDLERTYIIDIVDDTKSYEGAAQGSDEPHQTTVSEVNEAGGYIVITDPLLDDFLVSANARILYPATDTSETENDFDLRNQIDVHANVVDVTPIYTGRVVDAAFENALDRLWVLPSDDYDAHNSDPEYVVRDSIELITMDGYAAVRLLPITEDHFLETDVKEGLAKAIFNRSAREQVIAQAKSDAIEGREEDEEQEGTVEETEEENLYKYFVPPKDFSMDHEFYMWDGLAETFMQSYAWILESTYIGGRKYLAKRYEISPLMTFFDNTGDVAAYMILEPFEVYWACPISITDEVSHTITYKACPPTSENSEPYDLDVCGTYAMSGEQISVTFKVKDKNFPVDSGELEIRIYDTRRSEDTRYATDEELGDVNGCGDLYSLSGGVLVFSSTRNEEDEYTSDVADMILADDYLEDSDVLASYTAQINSEGEVVVTLPALDRIALLEVHAIYYYDDKSRVVCKQNIYYRSPVVIEYTGPTQLTADGETTYNLSARVTWMETEPVADGTIVNFQVGSTPLSPSVSQTVDGIAQGVILGPRQPVVRESEDNSDVTSAYSDLAASSTDDGVVAESLTISTSYRGFNTSKDEVLKWGTEEEFVVNFYFQVQSSNPNNHVFQGTDKFWADGIDYVVVIGDLPESMNRAFPFIDLIAPDLIDSRMGVLYSGSGLIFENRLSRWGTDTPLEGTYSTNPDLPDGGWAPNNARSNKFVGRPPLRQAGEDGKTPCSSPECVEINATTRSNKFSVVGTGIDSYTVSFLASTLSGSEKIPKPRIYPVEPLGVAVSFEPVDRTEYQSAAWRENPACESPKSPGFDTYSHPLVRDGVQRYLAVAEVTWRDEYIVGTEENPWPEVRFASGTYSINTETQSIEFEETDDFSLDNRVATVSISRTTFDRDHFHECYVDENGVGFTTVTITYTQGESIVDHTHAINLGNSQPIADAVGTNSEGTEFVHSHTPRAVAIVGCGPLDNATLSLAVQGYCSYDNGKLLSDGTRVSRDLDNYAFAIPTLPSAPDTDENRYFLDIITQRQNVDGQLVSSISTSSSKDDDGTTVIFHAYLKLEDGTKIAVPDGMRVFATFAFYQAEESDEEDNEILIINASEISSKKYAILEITGRLSGLPDELYASKQVVISSSLNWFPYINVPVLRDPTNDPIYIQQAFDAVGELGASQINDALVLAANRLIELPEAYDDWQKLIILISDGGENLSEVSFEQAVDSVNSVEESGEVPIFAVKLSDTDLFDTVFMKYYAGETDGEYFKVGQPVGTVTNTAEAVVRDVMLCDNFPVLTGTYTNVVDLGDEYIYRSLRFAVYLKPETSLRFRIRFSNDSETYGSWITLPNKVYGSVTGELLQWHKVDLTSSAYQYRYLQYEITFKGSITFESPEFSALEYGYYEPGRYILFFQPIELEDNGYVGEIIFAHEGTVPTTSTIRYGLTHDDNLDLNFYGSEQQPWFQKGTAGVVLSRYNEKTTTIDYRSYTAVNGGWNDSYEVELYRVSAKYRYGALVDKDSYSVDADTGTIVFNSAQPSTDEFTVTVALKPYFRLAVDMTNYGPDTITLDNLGFTYNLVEREDLSPVGDHRDIISLVSTDLNDYLALVQGTLTQSYALANSSLGQDTDVLVDILNTGVAYVVLRRSSNSVYVDILETNFTPKSSNLITLSATPIAFAYLNERWYFVSRSTTGYTIHRFDSTFNVLDSFDAVISSADEDDLSGNVFYYDQKWYVTGKDKIFVLSRSWAFEKIILTPFPLAGPIVVNQTGVWALSQFQDVVWGLSFTGAITTVYNLDVTKNMNNLRYVDGVFYRVVNEAVEKLDVITEGQQATVADAAGRETAISEEADSQSDGVEPGAMIDDTLMGF